jgi:hypothetical protein
LAGLKNINKQPAMAKLIKIWGLALLRITREEQKQGGSECVFLW